MFKKIISRLPYSPSMIHNLGFYAKRLHREEATRKIGLVLTALALIIQSFTVFSPPESANAADSSDLIYGGISSGSQLMAHYDANTNNIHDLFNHLGISRSDLLAATGNLQTLNSNMGTYSWGLTPHFGASRGEESYVVRTSQGGARTFYYRPHNLWGSFSYRAFVGYSLGPGWFAIMLNCGNLILKIAPPNHHCPTGQVGTYPYCSTPPTPVATCNALDVKKNGDTYQLTANASAANGATIQEYIYKIYRGNTLVKTIKTNDKIVTYTEKTPGSYKVTLTVKTSLGDKTSEACTKTFTIPETERCPQNPKLLKDDPQCQPCPADSTLWINDSRCSASFVQTKSASNLTQNNADATTVVARSGDRITYTLSVKNKGLKEEEFTFKDQVGDVLEYADIFDAGGGTLNDDRNASAGSTNAKFLIWKAVKIKPGESQKRSFTIQIKNNLSAMANGKSNPTSYDCRIDNTFGNTVSTKVDCPAPKVIEQATSQLPKTGASENMLFAGVISAVVVFFYARSRQLNKEVRIIRRDMSAGTL